MCVSVSLLATQIGVAWRSSFLFTKHCVFGACVAFEFERIVCVCIIHANHNLYCLCGWVNAV